MEGKEHSQTVRKGAETAAMANLMMADQHNTWYNNLEHIQMQPEDIREQLERGLPFIITCTVTACRNDIWRTGKNTEMDKRSYLAEKHAVVW